MKDTAEQWEKAAEVFFEAQEQSEFADVNKAVVRKRFSHLNGEKVLDLGCGYGYYAGYFDRIGGCVTGVDGAEKMIRIAKEKYPGIDFSVADLSDPLSFDDGTFDIVFCNQVLMDIEDIGPALREVRRVLKDHGIFYFSIVHPAFYNGDWLADDNGYNYAKYMSRYITPYTRQNHFWGETTHFHRPLSYYLNAAADAGLVLVHTDEPKTYDGVTKNDELPLFFFAEYRKASIKISE